MSRLISSRVGEIKTKLSGDSRVDADQRDGNYINTQNNQRKYLAGVPAQSKVNTVKNGPFLNLDACRRSGVAPMRY